MNDFILPFQGQAGGDVATALLNNNFDPMALKPWVGKDGRIYQAVLGQNGKYASIPLIGNANATLRKDEWILLDEAVVRVAKERLGLITDLRSSGLALTLTNGLAKTVLQYQAQSDITEAIVSMDGINESESDRPVYNLTNLPLPIIHKDFSFTARELAVSRNSNTPLDTTMAELATRRCFEQAEAMALGTASTYTYGGGTVYGLTSFPSRLTKVMTLPTAIGYTPDVTVTEILAMRAQSVAAKHYGPWKLYNSPNWDAYLDADYSQAKGDNTLRDRILKTQGISSMKTLDYLTGYQMLLVQGTSDVIRIVIGMDFQTVKWETHGGMKLNFKVMGIMVPQMKVDINGTTGIVHGTAV